MYKKLVLTMLMNCALGGKKCAKQSQSTHIFTVLKSSARISRNVEDHQVRIGCFTAMLVLLIHPKLGACN